MMVRACVVALVVAIGWGSWAQAADGKVALKTELPDEILAGTPPDVLALLYPHLEPLPEGEPPEFMVPEGTVNLALKKKVTASEKEPFLGTLELVTDGKKDGGDGHFVELGPGLQWVQIDLGKTSEIFAIYVWHFFSEARSYEDVIVQIADDPDFKKNCRTVYSNDQDNSAGKGIGKSRPYIETYRGRLFDAKGMKGRFVRLYSKGNTANDYNHYIEVEVFGKPAS